ncbi:MAG: hypothetical protein B7Y83_05940 [Flavobacteriales bacterium 32-34-25]|nr:MAG: hypothetical protein B7Y83_05940 [Flavobacteriales bacterium 32-34-25]
MKKILLLILFVSGVINAQETEFTFDNTKGMTDFVVTSVEGKTAPEIYKKVLDWIKLTYKNPEKVILSTIENEYIRFEGIDNTFYSVGIMGKNYRDVKYQIEISVKDGKYKFDLISMYAYWQSTSRSSGGWSEVTIFNGNSTKESLEKSIYNKSGELRGYYKYTPEVVIYYNKLNKSLFDSINTSSKNNDW